MAVVRMSLLYQVGFDELCLPSKISCNPVVQASPRGRWIRLPGE